MPPVMRYMRGSHPAGSKPFMMPWRITVGPRGLAKGVVELTSRRTNESEELTPEAAIDRLAQIYAGV